MHTLLALPYSSTAFRFGKSALPRVWALALALVTVPDSLYADDSALAGLRWTTVMPLPREVHREVGEWVVGREVTVEWGNLNDGEARALGRLLDRVLAPLGRSWRTAPARTAAEVILVPGSGDEEAYTLQIANTGVRIHASGPAGRFYGLQTLAQLLPSRARRDEPVYAAAGRIVDSPALSWRGLLVDSSRHFLSVDSLKWVLEMMSRHKLNRFHWHLTDDQGWRLEVPGWPRLTSVGAWRTEANGDRVGGFYSASDVRTLVDFASERHIVIVPEIDLPGHSSAALAAYPELAAVEVRRQVPLDWAVPDGVLSIGRPSVTRFTSDLLTTVKSLFPGPWIHWGGDEVFRSPWLRNDESVRWMRDHGVSTAEQAVGVFWRELARQTLAAGRIPIGWDEVALLGTPRATIVQWWDDPSRAAKAVREGHPFIASWKEAVYLDYPEVDSDGDRAWWMPVQTAERVASQPLWPPSLEATEARPLLLGVEATLFTERVTEPQLGRKLFPRLALFAETGWRAVRGGVSGWRLRLEAHRQRLSDWGVGMLSPGR